MPSSMLASYQYVAHHHDYGHEPTEADARGSEKDSIQTFQFGPGKLARSGGVWPVIHSGVRSPSGESRRHAMVHVHRHPHDTGGIAVA